MSNIAWLAFLAAAAVGAPARYLIDGLVGRRFCVASSAADHTEGAFPWGTFVVNVSGCLILGTITGLGLYHGLDTTTRTVLGTGGMGAYTTFSTFSFETVRLAEEGAVNQAMRNIAASLIVGLIAASAGLALAAAL
jgi:fluoride exporter